MTLAFYAVLVLHARIDADAAREQRGRRRRWTRGCSIAIVLIFAELMIVTAVALFFSTFSSPLLADVADARPVGGRALQRRPSQLRERRRSRRSHWLAKALYYVLPNLAPFDVKAEVVHGVPIAMRHVGFTLVYAVVYIAHPADGGDGDFPAARFQVSSRDRHASVQSPALCRDRRC